MNVGWGFLRVFCESDMISWVKLKNIDPGAIGACGQTQFKAVFICRKNMKGLALFSFKTTVHLPPTLNKIYHHGHFLENSFKSKQLNLKQQLFVNPIFYNSLCFVEIILEITKTKIIMGKKASISWQKKPDNYIMVVSFQINIWMMMKGYLERVNLTVNCLPFCSYYFLLNLGRGFSFRW